MKQKLLFPILFALFFSSALATAATQMASDRISDIQNTKHNFASEAIVNLPGGDERDVKAVSENQVCVFCHTPHGDPTVAKGDRAGFLWNRAITGSGYTRYTSSSLSLAQGSLGEGSKMCLSCHDGTVAIGQLDVINGRLGSEVGDVNMIGNNVSGGLLRGNANLGTDLRNDHPVGFLYAGTAISEDGELIDPDTTEGDHIGVAVGRGLAQNNVNAVANGGTRGTQPITTTTDDLSDGTITTGISVPLESVVGGLDNRDSDGNLVSSFVAAPGSGSVECTSCHDPHIRSTDNTVNIKFLRLRRFQKTTGPVPVDGFKINNDINCLACHKKAGWENSAHANASSATQVYDDIAADEREFPLGIEMWEASCLNCHAPHTVSNARWLLTHNENTSAGSEASDVDRSCYKCHTNNSPAVTSGAAVIDTDALTGGHAGFTFVPGDSAHRPTNADLSESEADLQVRHVGCSDCHNPHRVAKGLHQNNGSVDNNNVSGALSGIAGLDVTASGAFDPYGTEDPPLDTELAVATKEYQICFKCHSSYGHGIGNISASTFSNTVMEFGSNATSAHPVVNSTTNLEINAGQMEPPFEQGIGVQTMYCSDCHTNTDLNNTPVSPQGSHNNDIASCITCHSTQAYNFTVGAAVVNSGFACQSAVDCAQPSVDNNANNLHVFHASQTTTSKNVCSNCHVKVPHGWSNKALLANLNDPNSADIRYYGIATNTVGPGSTDVKSKIDTMSIGGQWVKSSCGTAGGCH